MDQKFLSQIEFIKEIDKLKSVERVSTLINSTRKENSAEHSWHFALIILTLEEYHNSPEPLDRMRMVEMALIHDLVEIDAGDTYCYDVEGHSDKDEREMHAAQRIFGLLPNEQAERVMALWREFEDGQTEEAKFARACDRLNPFMLNYYAGGAAWKVNGITKTQALGRMGEIEYNVPQFWPYVMEMIEGAVEKGWLLNK